jgi:PAS domain S-box-containing protein
MRRAFYGIPMSIPSDRPEQKEEEPHDADYRRLFDLSLDLLCVAGIDGFFKLVSPAWTRVMGWSEAELLARPVEEFMHPDDRARTLQARSNLARGVPVRGLENRYLCKDGSYRWLAWQSAIDEGGTTVYAVARDVTERRRRDQEQLVFNKLECTGIFAAGIAHDFNNLLASLRLNLDMVGVYGATNREQETCLRGASEALDAAKSLTQQLITFAAGGGPARQPIDLKNLLLESFHFALVGSALRGDCSVAPDLWRTEVDKTQIGQVICGLVLNAREASPANESVRLEAENVVLEALLAQELPAGNYVRIRITDHGGGIPAEIIPKVFDPYFSTKARGTQKGMGMGLTLCRSILHKHGGAIAIESQPGRGTVVTCYLPAKVSKVEN